MNPTIVLMVEKAERALKGAKDAFKDENLETAVSRAYYTMFHLVQAILFTKGLSFSKHSAVISAFAVHFTKPGLIPRAYHNSLHEAQDDRHIADYDIHFTLTEEEVKEQIQRAEVFLAMAVKYLEANP